MWAENHCFRNESFIGSKTYGDGWRNPKTKKVSNDTEELPDYLNDLNAMHEAWTTMSLYDRNMFTGELIGIVQRTPGAGTLDAINATAAHRAEAFLKTLGLWTEE